MELSIYVGYVDGLWLTLTTINNEAENARSFDLDREAWVLIVCFPKDLKNAVGIAKAVSSFGIMVHWHEPDNLARVVVKVYLNDDAKIPDSVKVNAGLP